MYDRQKGVGSVDEKLVICCVILANGNNLLKYLSPFKTSALDYPLPIFVLSCITWLFCTYVGIMLNTSLIILEDSFVFGDSTLYWRMPHNGITYPYIYHSVNIQHYQRMSQLLNEMGTRLVLYVLCYIILYVN